MSDAASAAKGGFTTWLVVVLLAVVGVGLVLPSGESEASPKLIGKRTGDVLVVPALKVKAPLVSVAMSPEQVLSPPRNPREVGWWRGSAPPGSGHGQTLVTGHTVHTGGGALDKLGVLKKGQQVSITKTTGHRMRVTRYRITDVKDYSKAEVTSHALELFGQEGGIGRLVLVTCTGWDGHVYHGNVVVLARPLTTTTYQV